MKHRIDITLERCPMTLVKVKFKLSTIGKGDTLEVLLSGGEPLENIGPSLQYLGYTVSEPKKENEFYLLEVSRS